jgi:hypothetical protein
MEITFRNRKLISVPSLFFVLVSLNALPLILLPYYPSLDGPVHLYNVNLLREMIMGGNPLITDFFSINRDIIPNWTSTFILAIFRLVLSSQVADKLFLLTIAFALPWTVFSLIRRVAPQNMLLSLFSLSFVYTYPFGLGFYNFCFGVVVYLCILNFWIGRKNVLASLMGLSGLLLLAYFTHILVFVLSFSSVGLYSVLQLAGNIRRKTRYQQPMKEIAVILMAGLPGLVLSFIYLSQWNDPVAASRLPLKDLLKWIFDARFLIIHNYLREDDFSRLVFFTAFGLIIYISTRYFSKKPEHKPTVQCSSPRFFAGLLSMIFLILYLVFPDESSGGSYLSVRLNLFFYLALFIWLTTFTYPKKLLVLAALVLFVATAGLTYRNYYSTRNYNQLIKNFHAAEEWVTAHSVILPITNNNWLLDDHFPSYLGWEKPVILLENYEASTGYFPVVWNLAGMPSLRLGDSIVSDVCLYTNFPASENHSVNIDYVIIWGDEGMDDCEKGIWTIVNRDFELIFSAEKHAFSLYKRSPAKGSK